MHITGWLLGKVEPEDSYLLLSWYVCFHQTLTCFYVFVYFIWGCICSIGLTIQANMYYKMLIGWTSQKIKDSYTVHNPFDFKHGTLLKKHLS